MRPSHLLAVVALTLVVGPFSALDAQGRSRDLPSHVCSGPAGARNPHCGGGPSPVEVPEPTSLALLLAGMGAVGVSALRRRSS